MRYLLALTTALAVCCCASCAGRTELSADSEQSLNALQDVWQDQLPPLPPQRSSSGTSVSERVGSNYLVKSSNAIEDGNRLDLLSGSNSLAWAYWQYTGGPRVVTSLEFVMDVPADNQYFVAVPDYRSGRWQFRGPFDSGRVFQADSFDFYSPDGDFYALALTAGGNKASVAAVNVTTEDNWQCITLRPDVSVNTQPLVEIVDGKPVVVWYDKDTDAFRILRSSTMFGEDPSDWNEQIWLFTGDKFVRYTDMAIINGKPAVTFSDGDSHDLNYFREGMDDYIVLSGDLNASGGRSSLLEVDGHAAISYRDGSGGDNSQGALVYMRSGTPNGLQGEDWESRVTVYGANQGFDKPDMQIVSGHPAIAAFDYSFENVMYCWTTDTDGMTAENWKNRTLYTSNDNPEFINLHVLDQYPAIAFKDAKNGEELWFLQAAVADPGDELNDWNSPFVIDSTGNVGQGTSLSSINGRPFISYLEDGSGTELRFAISNTLNGIQGSWQKGLVEDENVQSSTLYTKALSIEGRMVICFLEYNGSDIRNINWCWREAGGLE
ncbi:hypothetical protein KDL29_13990 [bacterium]|nr:hypothetical protein [bacterium]